MVLEIEIPKGKQQEVIDVLKALGVKIKGNNPNQQTTEAIEDARAGKTKKIKDINAFMDSL
jgi:hypothetical protein